MNTRELLRKSNITAKVNTTNDWELAFVNVELYPNEILYAAQTALGEKITDYFAEMYKFAYDAKELGVAIKITQLSGVLLTHKKIEHWLASLNINDALDIDDPHVTKIFLEFHIKQMKRSVALFETVARSINK